MGREERRWGGKGVFLRSGSSLDVRCVKTCVVAPDLAFYSPVRRERRPGVRAGFGTWGGEEEYSGG